MATAGRGRPDSSSSAPGAAHAAALSRCLGQIHYAVAVTAGPVATLSQIGPYLDPTMGGGPLLIQDDAIALRLDTDGGLEATLSTDHTATRPTSVLRVRDPYGSTVHRVRVQSDADRAALDQMVQTRYRVRLRAASGRRRFPWRDGDLLAQLDAAAASESDRTVDSVLAGGVECRRLIKYLVPEIARHLCAVAMPFGMAVARPGLLHACAGVLQSVGGGDITLLLQTGDAQLELSLPDVAECLIIRVHGVHGETSAIEFFDEQGRTAAIFAQLGLVDRRVHRAWEAMVASLPVR